MMYNNSYCEMGKCLTTNLLNDAHGALAYLTGYGKTIHGRFSFMPMVTCRLCRKSFKRIEGTHLKHKHGITMDWYKLMFPDAKITSQETSARVSAANKTRWREDNSYREKMSQRMQGDANIVHKTKIDNRQRQRAALEVWRRPGYKQRALKRLCSKESRERASKQAKEKLSKFWNDPMWRERRADAMRGDKNPNWKNGISFEEYGKEFTRELREFIRATQCYCCKECNIHQDSLPRRLDVHHTDKNKKNNHVNNLEALCRSCHQQKHHG